MRRGRTPQVGLDDRVDALRSAVEVGRGRVPDDLLAAAEGVLRRTDERRARGDGIVVVALVGGTGTGKSSLFNALAGSPFAPVDVRRPTTDAATSWSVGDRDETDALLDWLEVDPGRRHHQRPDRGSADLDGLVLLDLPDLDSVVTHNRTTADRLIERVDVLVWVVDPHKYAQRSLHEGYLAALREHAEVMLVVLNQVDRLDDAERRICRTDLERLVRVDGRGPEVLATSATTGEGLEVLRASLGRTVQEERAVAERIAADVRTEALRLQEATAPPRDGRSTEGGRRARGHRRAEDDRGVGGAGALDPTRLVVELEALADLDGFAAQAEGRYVVAARRRARTPLLDLLQALLTVVRAVTSRLGLVGRLLAGGRPTADGADATPGSRGDRDAGKLDAQHALLAVVEQARHDLPWYWAAVVDTAADEAGTRLPAAVKSALAPVPRDPEERPWWGRLAVVWGLVELAGLVAVLWLLADRVVAWFGLPGVPVPQATERWSWPALVLAVSVVIWLVLAWVRRRATRRGARRHAAAVRDRAGQAVSEAVRRTALAPVAAELDAYAELRRHLEVAAT